MNEKWEFRKKEKKRETLNVGQLLQKEAGWPGENQEPVPSVSPLGAARTFWT